MRILLIYPDLHIHVNYPVGLGIISAVLKQEGHDVEVLHFNEEMGLPLELSVLDARMRDFDPQMVAFSSVSNQFQYVKEMASFIKKRADVPIVVGGIHATISPEKVLRTGTIDIVCRGEGEGAMLDLVTCLEEGRDHRAIENLGFVENGSIGLNPLRPLIDAETFDALPYPDREGFNFGDIVTIKRGWANVMASRGCLNKCTYCVNHYYHKLYASHHSTLETLRYRKVDTVLREIEEMRERYPMIALVNFDDDNIALNRSWIEEFSEEYPRRVGIPFACNAHPQKFDRTTARLLAGAGCVEVKIGIEAGSERLRRDILKRPSRQDAMIEAFAAAEEAGIRAWSFNMIGIPTETREEILMTAQLNARIRPYIVRCAIFFPYEGTDLYRYAAEHSLLDEERAERVSSHLEDSVLDMPQLSREEIVKFKSMFKWYVDAYSEIEAAPVFKVLLWIMEKLPPEAWVTGKGQELFRELDRSVDALLRELKMEHYATRGHLDLNFTGKFNYELP